MHMRTPRVIYEGISNDKQIWNFENFQKMENLENGKIGRWKIWKMENWEI